MGGVNNGSNISICLLFKHCILFLLLISVSAKNSTKKEKKGKMFEGDIDMSKKEMKELKKEIKYEGATHHPRGWRHGLVPYTISSNFSMAETEMINDAISDISENTCIKFKPRHDEKDYISIIVSKRCSSKVGRHGGLQIIKLHPSGCMKHGTIVHEMIHALGFWHEQSRLDRDKYINIKWKNIKTKSKHNFRKYSDPNADDFGLPYDFGSIMHYSRGAFSKQKGLKTIVPKTKDAPIGIRSAMSHFDKLKLNTMYGCKDYLEGVEE